MLAAILGTIWAVSILVSLIVMVVTWWRHGGEPRGENPVREVIYLLPPAIFAVGPQLIHLIAVQARWLSPVLEMTAFAAWWYAVFQWNMRSKTWYSTRILVSFALQWTIMYLLRSYVY